MKIAVSSKGKNLESEVDEMFGRCPYFAIAEIEGKKIKSVEFAKNSSALKSGGAGVSAAQFVAGKGAQAVVAGSIGPRAAEVFKQFDIKTVPFKGTVKDALHKFL